MKITAQFDYLYTGESNSRTLYLERDEKYADKNICLGFVTPLGRLYITDPILFTGNSCEYLIPEGLLDGRGKLFVQLIATEGEEYVAKSKLYEYPVFASVDDLSLPEASAEDVKSIAVLFEMVKKKADEGHQHDDRYYTEEETDELFATHQHSWEEIKGRPGETSFVKQCTLELHDVYEVFPNHYVCSLTGAYGEIESGMDARVTVKLVGKDAYEAVCEIQHEDGGYPFISFNNDLKTEDFINGTASFKVSPIDDSLPAFIVLFCPNDYLEVFLPGDEYEGAEIDIYTESVVKLSNKALYTTDTAVEGSRALITSEGTRRELDKKSDREHLHDDRYYTEEEVKSLLSVKSNMGHKHDEYLTEDDLPAPPVIPVKVSELQNDAGYVTIEHNHDGRYYTEEEVNTLLSEKSDSAHQHSWEEINGRPGEVSNVKQCTLVLDDVYELFLNHYTCNMKGDYSGIKSGMNADVSISLADGNTYEAVLEVQDDGDGHPLISFNNDLTTEDFINGTATLKVTPVDDSIPAFIVLFFPDDDYCEVYLPKGEYEGAVIDIYAEDIVKLSAKAFEAVDAAVEGSKALITSGGVKKELDKLSDREHSHDDRYYTEAEVNALLSGKSDTGHAHGEYLTEDDLPEAPEIPTKVSELQNDAGYVSIEHEHDGRYYTENEVNTLLSGKSNTGHTHEEYLTEDDLPATPVIPKKVSELQNDAGYVTADHDHDSRYYTAEEIDSKLTGVDVSGHNHDDRYYTEAETDELLGSHQHSWEDINGRPGEVSYTKQCDFVMTDVYELFPNHYTCYLTGVGGNIISGMTVRVTISLAGKGTYEDILEVQNEGVSPFISFNNDLKTEDFINGTGTVEVSPIDDSLPAFIVLFFPNGSCEVHLPDDGYEYEGARVSIFSGGIVKLSDEALNIADTAVEGSSALLTSGGAKTELDKKSDIGHNHDGVYMPKELVITGVLDMANGTITGASASFGEISEAVEAGFAVKLQLDISSAIGEEGYVSAPYLLQTGNSHIFDVVTDFGGPALIRAMCLASDSWVVTLSPIASVSALQDYYSKSEVNTLLEESETTHSHSYLALRDIPTIHNNIAFAGNITTNDLIYKGLLTSDDNLDEVFDDGVYIYTAVSLPKNAPFKNDTVVEVFGSRNNTGQKIQRAYRSDEEGYSAFRPFNDNGWLSWSYPSVTTEKTVTGTTSAEGALSLGLSSSEYIVLSAYCASYVCIPYCSASGEWEIKVINGNTMTPVTSAAVEIICFYTKRIKE